MLNFLSHYKLAQSILKRKLPSVHKPLQKIRGILRYHQTQCRSPVKGKPFFIQYQRIGLASPIELWLIAMCIRA